VALTLEQEEAELLTINSAISSIYSGKRLNLVTVGTNEFHRAYRFTDPQDLLKTLLSERRRLQDYIASIQEVSTRVFRKDSYIPLIVKRHL